MTITIITIALTAKGVEAEGDVGIGANPDVGPHPIGVEGKAVRRRGKTGVQLRLLPNEEEEKDEEEDEEDDAGGGGEGKVV
jgi:hypothetical protein